MPWSALISVSLPSVMIAAIISRRLIVPPLTGLIISPLLVTFNVLYRSQEISPSLSYNVRNAAIVGVLIGAVVSAAGALVRRRLTQSTKVIQLGSWQVALDYRFKSLTEKELSGISHL